MDGLTVNRTITELSEAAQMTTYTSDQGDEISIMVQHPAEPLVYGYVSPKIASNERIGVAQGLWLAYENGHQKGVVHGVQVQAARDADEWLIAERDRKIQKSHSAYLIRRAWRYGALSGLAFMTVLVLLFCPADTPTTKPDPINHTISIKEY